MTTAKATPAPAAGLCQLCGAPYEKGAPVELQRHGAAHAACYASILAEVHAMPRAVR